VIARNPNPRLPGFALGLAVLLGAGRPATAQHQTADPYDPYGAAYAPFVTNAPFPLTAAPYARNLAPGGSAANQLDSYYSSIGLGFDTGAGLGPSFTPGRTRPYTQAYRRLDEDLNRVYRPNARIDADFSRDQQARQRAYFQREAAWRAYYQALNEKDPKKRAEMLRRVGQMNRQITSELNAPRRAPAATASNANRPSMSPLPGAYATPRAAAPAASPRPNSATTPARSPSAAATVPGLRRPPTSTEILERSLRSRQPRTPLRTGSPLAPRPAPDAPPR
jgi:hypothetical protein